MLFLIPKKKKKKKLFVMRSLVRSSACFRVKTVSEFRVVKLPAWLMTPSRSFMNFSAPPSAPPPASSPPPSGKPRGAPGGGAPGAKGQASKLITPVGEANWDIEIMQSDRPVILEAGAEWCQPCKQLAPLLEQAARQNPGIKFCYMDSDREERICQDLQIKSLPTLLAIFQGKLLEAPLVGLPTPKAFSDFVARVASAGSELKEQAQAAESLAFFLSEGERLMEMGDINGSAKSFEKAIQVGGENAPAPFAGMALLAMSQGDVETAEEIMKKVRSIKGHEQFPLVKKALGSVDLARSLQELVAQWKDTKTEAESLDDKFKKSVFMCVSGRIDEAIDSLIGQVKSDRSNSRAKDLLFKVFNALGATHPVVISGRKKLAQALFM